MKTKQNSILVYGRINFENAYDGESTKLINIWKALKEKYINTPVDTFRILGWKKHPISMLFNLRSATKKHNIFIMIPGPYRGMLFSFPYFARLKKKKNIFVFYPVAGNSVLLFLKRKPNYIKYLAALDQIFCETQGLCAEMKSLGLNNVSLSPVFSLRKPVAMNKEHNLPDFSDQVLRLCTFSRVSETKGITIAIKAVAHLLLTKPNLNIALDVYGKIDTIENPNYGEILKQLMSQFPKKIKYHGIIPDESVIETLTRYDACVFASFFFGECFPASVLEAFMAGTPVIASDWHYNTEFVHDGVSGLIFKTNDQTDLEEKILWCVNNRQKLYSMRNECVEEAKEYTVDKSLRPLFDFLDPIILK